MPSVASRYAKEKLVFERPSEKQEQALRAPVVLMVSGGADSTALLVRAATSTLDIRDGRGEARIARERLHVLHVNHQLRGINAEEDMEFVRDLADAFGVPCTIERADVSRLAKIRFGGNIENAGREVRYAVANKLADKLSAELGTPRSAARILTAHTANDRAETFFMNAIKGSGTSGLSSIPRRRGRIVRPLLDCTHEELCQQLRMSGIVWREDASNNDTRQLRSFVRHEIIPVAQQRNARVISSIAGTCDILSDEDAYLNQLAATVLRTLERRRSENSLALDAARLAATEVAIARRVVRRAVLSLSEDCRLESRHIAEVLKIVAAGKGSLTIPLGIDVRLEYGLLFIHTQRATEEPAVGWLEVPGRFSLSGNHELSAKFIDLAPGTNAETYARSWSANLTAAGAARNADTARITGTARTGGATDNTNIYGKLAVLLDAEACGLADDGSGRLFVDTPQPGDVVCPFGMHGQSKKLSDLLNEAQVPTSERPSICVIRTAPRGRIVWVVGIRMDERAKCLPTSRKLVKLELR